MDGSDLHRFISQVDANDSVKKIYINTMKEALVAMINYGCTKTLYFACKDDREGFISMSGDGELEIFLIDWSHMMDWSSPKWPSFHTTLTGEWNMLIFLHDFCRRADRCVLRGLY